MAAASARGGAGARSRRARRPSRTAAGRGSRRSLGRAGAAPRGSRSPRRRRAGRAWPRTACGCRDGADRGRSSTSRPSRRSRRRTSRRPGRRPAPRSGRSCVTRITVRPSSLPSVELRLTSSSRICACTITSSAVVGSSASSTLGAQRERHRDRGALAHPPRELVRVAVGPIGRDADELEQLPDPQPAPPCRCASPWSSIGSAICAPIVFTGLNAFMAPWKTIEMSVQRCGLIDSSPRARMSSPARITFPDTDALAGRSRPIIARIVVVLPQPDSPTRPIRSPSFSSKVTPCTAWSSPPLRQRRTRRGGPRP